MITCNAQLEEGGKLSGSCEVLGDGPHGAAAIEGIAAKLAKSHKLTGSVEPVPGGFKFSFALEPAAAKKNATKKKRKK